jgi:hypothetical protein
MQYLRFKTQLIQTSRTFAQIGNSQIKRFVHVVADETNEGKSTLYFHDSIGLNYIPTNKIY